MDKELRSFWKKYIRYDWRFGLFLLLVICIPRFFLVLQANQTGQYATIGLLMLLSALVPFVFLSKEGQQVLGIRTSCSIRWAGIMFKSCGAEEK